MFSVAIGIITRQQKILVALRKMDAEGALWELPGGKIEVGETAQEALRRELKEEIGIEVTRAQLVRELNYDYPEYSVHLKIFHVTRFDAEPQGAEGQQVRWVTFDEFKQLRTLSATALLMDTIQSLV